MTLKWERNPNEGAVTTGEVVKSLVDGAPGLLRRRRRESPGGGDKTDLRSRSSY